MIFNVSGLVQDGIGATRELAVDDELRVLEGEPEHVTGSVQLMRLNTGVLVRAHLQVTHKDTCSRCLQPSEEALHLDFEEEFKATLDLTTGKPLDEELPADVFLIDSQHILDLTEAVRQYREAAVEMQPLCKPDCLGLCPECGSDLNAGSCSCQDAVIDVRWAGLAALLQPEDAGGTMVKGKE